jgi:hypothetical protein
MLRTSEIIVKAAQQEFNQTLDYSIDSFKDLEALIQYVRARSMKLKNEGELSEQTIQSASVSIGAYLGEVIRRHYGGNWIATNAVMKILIINGQEFSPILYAFQRLAQDSDYSLEKYWSDIHQELSPEEKTEDETPVLEVQERTTEHRKGNRNLITVGAIVLGLLLVIGLSISPIKYGNAIRIPPTSTPRPPAIRIPVTSTLSLISSPSLISSTSLITTPSLIVKAPSNYLQNLPSGYVVNDSIPPKDTTLEDGTRAFDIALTNKQALNHGDPVSARYLITFYQNETTSASEYYRYLVDLNGQKNAVLDGEVNIDGTDASAMYLSFTEDKTMMGQYTSRIKNVIVTTVGITIFDPQTVNEAFLKSFMADVLKIHMLAVEHTH